LDILKCKIKSYIQPFEKKLALAELSALGNATPQSSNSSEYYTIQTNVKNEYLIRKLGYWEAVDGASTMQVLREATVNIVRNSISPKQIQQQLPLTGFVQLPNRRVLRYASHGIHEYRGKFFPQLVKSLINIGNTPDKGIVADPMCGSGTTIVEAVLGGNTGIGIDTNPLSAFISRTKIDILSVEPAELVNEYQKIHTDLITIQPEKGESRLAYFLSLPEKDQVYVSLWFSEQVLLDLDQIRQKIDSVINRKIKNFMLIALSNILRKVSYQKEADLRVRKEMKNDTDLYPIKEFLEELGRSVRIVLAFLYQNRDISLGQYHIFEGNALDIPTLWNGYKDKVDVVITSPPYATALPYLDTDRLSLCYLGLLSRPDQAKRNLEMIGNREVTENIRKNIWAFYKQENSLLPSSVTSVIETIDQLNAKSDVGFRRKNLSALLGKYFVDMRTVLNGILAVLKPGGKAFVVVGSNHTIAGGQRIEIHTPELLAEIGTKLGFIDHPSISMEMLVSREIFKKNAVASESILILEKPI